MPIAPAFAISPDQPGIPIVRMLLVARRIPTLDSVRAVVVDFGTADTVTVELRLPILSPADLFRLTLAAVDANGDTVYRAMVDSVAVTTGPGPTRPIAMPLVYAGADTVVDAVTIAPRDTTLFVGDVFAMRATATRADGSAKPDAALKFVSRGPAIVAVTHDGQLSAVAAGSAWIVVGTANGKFDSTRVTAVVKPPLSRIDAGVDRQVTAIGDTVQLAPAAFDALGAPVQGVTFAYASADPAVASVSQAGIVTAAGVGTARIVVSTSGVSDTVLVTVTQVIASLAITPDTLRLAAVGSTGTVTATARDHNGHPVGGAVIAYSSTDVAIATVSTTGVVTLVAPGIARITAAAGGRSAQTVVIKTPSVVGINVDPAWIDVAPATATLRVGDTLALDALLVYADSTMVPIVPLWATSQPGRAGVSPTGIVTAFDTGAVTITATDSGVTGQSRLTILPAPMLTSFAFSPRVLNGVTAATLRASVTVGAYDEGSGIASVQVTFTGPSGATRSCSATTPTVGRPASGTWDCVLSIPAGSAPGAWHATQLVLQGTIARTFDETALSAFGATTLTVNP